MTKQRMLAMQRLLDRVANRLTDGIEHHYDANNNTREKHIWEIGDIMVERGYAKAGAYGDNPRTHIDTGMSINIDDYTFAFWWADYTMHGKRSCLLHVDCYNQTKKPKSIYDLRMWIDCREFVRIERAEVRHESQYSEHREAIEAQS